MMSIYSAPKAAAAALPKASSRTCLSLALNRSINSFDAGKDFTCNSVVANWLSPLGWRTTTSTVRGRPVMFLAAS